MRRFSLGMTVSGPLMSNQTYSFESTDRGLDRARTQARNGQLAEAEGSYRKVLDEHPDQVEALRFVANAAISRGNAGEAVALLSRAVRADRSDTGALLELGVAYRNAQRMDEARSVLELALEQSHGRNATTRLLLANVMERDARPDMALLHYFRSILDAQTAGRWLDAATTEPGLQSMVLHAMRYVSTGRRKLFDDALERIREGGERAHAGRVDAALAYYLGEQSKPGVYADRQPTFLFLPDLGSDRFLANSLFDWLGQRTGQIASLDVEATACLDHGRQANASTPLFSLEAMADRNSTAAVAASAHWVAVCQHGTLEDAARQHAPRLVESLDGLPLVRIPGYAPDVAVLGLPPATRTPQRHGRSNAFCTVVITFSHSAPLQVTVGSQTRTLRAAESLIFDPSFEFSFASDGDTQARALVFDIWHPAVVPPERDALGALAAAAVAFDRRLQELT